MATSDRKRVSRESFPLVRAIAEECARVLGGSASEHVRRAKQLLNEGLSESSRWRRAPTQTARIPVTR